MHLSAGAHGRSRTVVHGAPRCQAAGMHQGAGAHRWWCTVVHGAIRCQAAGMHLGARCTQASVHLLRDSLITHNTMSVPKRPDAPRCTVHLGARRPGCTSVQVHGDPNAPHQGAGAARAPCVTLLSTPPTVLILDRDAFPGQSNTLMAHQPKQSKSGIDRYSIPLWPGGGNGA